LTFAAALSAYPAKEMAKNNPLAGSPAAIKEGASLFRSNCSPCHGLNAQGGGRGPSLASGRWIRGSSDETIFRTITRGVAGTDMPGHDFPDSEVWAIIAYLRSLAPGDSEAPKGDAAKGRTIFWETLHCSRCHMVDGRGGILGPELSRVGAGRSDAYLAESIRQPDADLTHFPPDPNSSFGPTPAYDTVIVVTSAGEDIRGVALNEDTFSIQLLDLKQQLHLLQKADLKQISHQRKSLMPGYSEEVLSKADLDHLLAYLGSLRGAQDLQ
jgi:putative heme-binding domain-containing protein